MFRSRMASVHSVSASSPTRLRQPSSAVDISCLPLVMAPSTQVFLLNKALGAVQRVGADGDGLRTVVAGYAGKTPDGVQIHRNRHAYYTVMGDPKADDGFIDRCDLDGSNIVRIVDQGCTFTPKQLQLDEVNQRLYWCDREGMRVMRCGLDGSNVEVLVQRGDTQEDRLQETRWCVGIAIDLGRQLLYWSQKGPPKGGLGAIYRCPLTPPPPGYTFSNRPDITTLFSFLPEPIDLQLDLVEQRLYWSDRGAGPDGNSLNSAYVGESEKMLLQQWEEDGERGYNVLRTGFQEAIGLALDVSRKRCFVADLEGGLFQIALDGTWSKTLFRGELGAVTGITLAEL